jgi:hypothetical protein
VAAAALPNGGELKATYVSLHSVLQEVCLGLAVCLVLCVDYGLVGDCLWR